MKTKYLILLSLLSTTTFPLHAQENVQAPANERSETPLPLREGVGVGLTLGADLVNQYIWRGQHLGNDADLVNQYIWRGQHLGNVSLQPTLGLEWKGLSLSTWGSVGLADAADDKEVDLTANPRDEMMYLICGLSLSL